MPIGQAADIVYPTIDHRPDCDEVRSPDDADNVCECPRGWLRCSADSARVWINPTTMQTAYCDGQPMHRWRITTNVDPATGATDRALGEQWIQVS